MIFVICGFMGCGKSFFTQSLKESSPRCQFLDLDDYILKKEGNGFENLGPLIEREGWGFFRAAEKKYLLQLLDQFQDKDLVLSLGGGTLNPETLSAIKKSSHSNLVWLNTPFDICYSRIKGDQNRPLVRKGEVFLRELYQQRLMYYKEASLILDEKDQDQIKNVDQLHDRL